MCLAKPIVLSLCCLVSVSLSGPSTAQERIQWLTELSQARKLAEQNQRLVLLHFWSDNCAPCRELEQNVFNQPELIRVISTHFVAVKINVLQEPRFADYYRIDRVPTDILVDSSGKELHRRTSPANVNEYLAMLDQVRAWAGTSKGGIPETVANESNRSPLPPRVDGSGEQFTSEPINTDPRSFALDSDTSRSPSLPGAMPPSQPATVQNEFVLPGATGAPSQSADIASRYGNPYIQPGAPQSTPATVGHSPRESSAAVPFSTRPWEADAAPGGTPQKTIQPSTSVTTLGGTQPQVGSTSSGNTSLASAPQGGQPYLPGTPFGGQQPQFGTASQTNLQNSTSAPAATLRPSAAPSTNPITLPPNAPPLAMDGYCPVTLVSLTKWVKGDPRWGAEHRGRTYLFASQVEKQHFMTDPDRFSPALSGYDPVRFTETRQLVDGRRESGVFFANTYYLFADDATLAKFEANPQGYVQVVRQAMANTGPHPPQR